MGMLNRGPSWLPQGQRQNPFGQGILGQQGGLMGILGRPETRDLAMSLLANSGYGPKRSFGEILGTSALQANQLGQQRQEAGLDREYRQAQLGQIGAQPTAVMGTDGRPVYVAERDAIGKSPFLRTSGADDGVGQYNPRDYTPKSWAQFLTDKDPSKLERYESPRQEFKPSFRNVTRTLQDGSTQAGSYDTSTGMYDWNGDIVPAGTKSRVDAQGKAEGEAAGGQAAKSPAKKSFDYVVSQFRPMLGKTMQGGLFGIKGKSGTVLDKANKERFENLREQLSTELRTVFRIPGEGTLSDQEQKQYGVQLPSTDYESQTNEQILNDVTERVRLRLESSIESSSAPSAPKQSLDDIRKKYGRKP